MKKILVANWKMKPTTLADVELLTRASDAEGVVLAPPFPYLDFVKKMARHAGLCVQNVFFENPKNGGAFTGEVSCAMAKAMGATYAIIGHSERRQFLGESDAMIARKVAVALEAGLIPILCVGERHEVRHKGEAQAVGFVGMQLMTDLSLLKNEPSELIVAYEPVWAIGTGNNATPEQASVMSSAIRKAISTNHPSLRLKVLYGCSVNAGNIAGFARERDIDGFLVGGASADAGEFPKLISIIHNL